MATMPIHENQPATAAMGDQRSAARLGQVFLDVRRRHLSFLDPVARQMHKEGVAYTPSDLDAHPLHTLKGEPVTGDDLPLVLAWREARPVETTFVTSSPQGAELWINWHAAPVRNEEGEIVGVVGAVRSAPPEPDWQVMAGLAHDLRTPLNAITLQIAVLNHLANANPDLARVLSGMQSSVERALRVGLDLLAMCRRTGGKGRGVEATWMPVSSLLADLAREQALAAKNKGLMLQTDFTASAGWEVHSDRIRLGRIIANLLVNAIRYTARGRVSLTTSWRDENGGRFLAIGVMDTGEGISPEEQESIFQPFERGKAGKEGDSGGSGLGLAVVDRLVEELGVELDVYSEHGRGSKFHLLIPPAMLRLATADGPGSKEEITVG